MLGRILAGLFARKRAAKSDAQDWLQVARQAVQAGNFAEAEAAYRTFLREQPTSRAANLELASTLEASGLRHDAARICMNVWALNPSDNEVLEYAIRLIDGLVSVDAAQEGSSEDDYVSLIARANAALATGNFEIARKLLEGCRAVDPRWPFTYQRLGCIEALAGNFDSASAHFSAWGAAGLAPDAYIDLRATFLESLDPGSDAWAIKKPEAIAQAVVFFACDPVYFRRFAHPLLQSLRENAGIPLVVHIHLFNPDQWIAEELGELPSGGNLLRVATSSEECAFDTGDRAKTHYSCARLYRVADLIAQYGLPVIMLDADVLVLRNLTPLLDLARDHDVALLRWPNTTWRIWDHVYASTVVYSASAGGRRFARMAERYVHEFITRPGGAWFLDQIALFATFAHLQGRGVAVARIPALWYALFAQDGDAPSDEAMFWTATANIPAHSRALSGPMIRKYLPETRHAYGWELPGSDFVFEALLAHAPTEAGKRRGDHARMQLAGGHMRMNRRRAIDIGAGVGFWSDWLATRFEFVEAFEHDPVMRKCFRDNIVQTNVTLHSPESGDIVAAPSVAPDSDHRAGTCIHRLDDFAFSDVDFVNIDAGGHASRVLRGAEQTLRRCKPLVLIKEAGSALAGFGDPPGTASNLLVGFGARLVAKLPDQSRLFSWLDGDPVQPL